MKQADHIAALSQTLRQLDESARWLRRSFTRCRRVKDRRELTPADLDAFEALTSRYARTSDMVLQKLFRGLDAIELEDGGTLLDALNRAEKRGLINSADAFREIRELRNEIAHEYARENLRPLFTSVLDHTPNLLEIIRKSQEYSAQYLKNSNGRKTNKRVSVEQ